MYMSDNSLATLTTAVLKRLKIKTKALKILLFMFMLVSVQQPAVWEQFELLKYKRRHFVNVSLHVFLFLPPWPCALEGSDLGLNVYWLWH